MSYKFRITDKLSVRIEAPEPDASHRYESIKDLLYISGLEYLYKKWGTDEQRWYPYTGAILCSRQQISGFGCGVDFALAELSVFIQLGEVWRDKKFQELVLPYVQCREGMHGKSYWTGSSLLCMTSSQRNTFEDSGTLQIMREEFIVHECGAFPNYTHGSSMMHLYAVNFWPHAKKSYPVAWDRGEDRGIASQVRKP